MKKKIFESILFVIPFFILNSCVKTQELSGIYSNEKPTKKEKNIFKTTKYINGSILALRKDSAYLYKTCGVFIVGSWSKKNDSLYLKVKTINFLNDSYQ